jgi:hypothetical protein
VKRALAHVQLLLQAFIARLADFGVHLLSRMVFSQIANRSRRAHHFGVGGKELRFELAEELFALLL